MHQLKSKIKDSLTPTYADIARGMYFRIRSVLYAGNKSHCPCCNRTFRTFIRYSNRPTALCPGCGSLERHRLFWLYLSRKTDLFKASLHVLHFAPAYILRKQLSQLANLSYITTDLTMPGVDLHMDITDILFKDETFNVIICSNILEHVPDDAKAMQELYRVLKPTGWMMAQVPIDGSLETTFEDPTVTTPTERARLFGQDDHVRQYGRDFVNRLESAGFSVEVYNSASDFSPEEVVRYGLGAETAITEDIFICTKDSRSRSKSSK